MSPTLPEYELREPHNLEINSNVYLVGTWANEKCWNPEAGAPFNESLAYKFNISADETESPVEQFWK